MDIEYYIVILCLIAFCFAICYSNINVLFNRIDKLEKQIDKLEEQVDSFYYTVEMVKFLTIDNPHGHCTYILDNWCYGLISSRNEDGSYEVEHIPWGDKEPSDMLFRGIINDNHICQSVGFVKINGVKIEYDKIRILKEKWVPGGIHSNEIPLPTKRSK